VRRLWLFCCLVWRVSHAEPDYVIRLSIRTAWELAGMLTRPWAKETP